MQTSIHITHCVNGFLDGKKTCRHAPGSVKSRIYAKKSTKRGFSKKALAKIEFVLFLVDMNPLKAWNAKLEAASFFAV